MNDLVMEESQLYSEEEFGESILSQFSNSIQEEHRHLCIVIDAIRDQLRSDQGLTPVAYLNASCATLGRLLSEPEPPFHTVASIIEILSLLFPRLSAAELRMNGVTSRLVLRVLRSRSAATNVGVVMHGLNCLAQLLTADDSVEWAEMSLSYNVLLGFVADKREEVRGQAHQCIRDVLQKLQGTEALAPASEAILNIFQNFLLLVKESVQGSSKKPEGSQEVLYVLDAFKECLSLMSTKCMAIILNRFKSLLKLCPVADVTRRVTDSLYSICLDRATIVPVEPTLELLCLLAISSSTKKTSADAITFTARLLNVGVMRVYSLNRDQCVVRLPAVFRALKDILALEHEEAIYAATETLKSLINSCVDHSLIREGVGRIQTLNLQGGNFAPTIIEKLSATVESLLDYRFSAVWDMAFQVISVMFDKLGDCSSYFMRGTLQNLSDMQKLPDEDFRYRKQLHECVGSAVSAMGPETFLSILPLKLEADDLVGVNVWLFPIVKKYTVGAQLSFFTETILSMVATLREKSKKLEAVGRINIARSADSLVDDLWSLLPSFCNYPMDTAETFHDLKDYLCNALKDQPKARAVICTSLHTLIQQNKAVTEGKDVSPDDVSPAMQRAISRYSPQLAAKNLEVLRSCARHFLSTLSSIDDVGCVQSAIGDFASIANKEIVTSLLIDTFHRLLKVTKDAGSEGNESSPSLLRAHLLDLAVSLLPGLDAKEVAVLFSAIKPALQDDEGIIQKKAYKVLSIILKNNDGFLSSNLEELIKLMTKMLRPCHFSAKRHRIDCLYALIAHVLKIEETELKRREIVKSLLTEIILALKEVKVLLEMLVGKCGLDAVKSVMPEKHMKLLTNIQKVKERKERKLAAGSDDGRSLMSKTTTSRHSRWNHSKLFSDFGDQDDVNSVRNRRSKASSLLKSKASLRSRRNHNKNLPEDFTDLIEGEPLDLLDLSKTRSALRSSAKLKRKFKSDDKPEFDPEGRLIIIHEGTKLRKKLISEADTDTKTETGSRALSINSSGKSSKRMKTSESGYAYTGREYASKKAEGDVIRKDKHEPYAYWPLDQKMMSRRPEQRAAARSGMFSVVKMTKKLEGMSVSRVRSKGSKKHK